MNEKPYSVKPWPSGEQTEVVNSDGQEVYTTDHESALMVRDLLNCAYALGRASAAPKEGEVERLEPNTFWPDNCEEGEGPSDLELIADGYEVGTVFAVQQAIMLPRGFYVSITDDKGCTDVRPATTDEIERFKAAEAERLEEWKRRAKQLPSALSPASEGGGA